MKSFKEWFLQHESLIIKILLFTVIGAVFYFYVQALHKDALLDKALMKVELIEEKNKAEQQIRDVYTQVIKEKDEKIYTLLQRDSVIVESISHINDQLDNLQKTYNAKAKIINSFGSDELREYFRNLPKQPDNDY